MDVMRLPRQLFDRSLDRWSRIPDGATLSLDERMEAFLRFGDHSLAYGAATQPGLRYHPGKDGFIAFGAMMGQAVALGNPIAPETGRREILRSFIADVGRPSFAGITQPVAAQLAELGYRVTQFGIDTALDLATYDFSGGVKKSLRKAEYWLLSHGYLLGEDVSFPGMEERLAKLSLDWRRQRVVKRREMTFLNRSYPKSPEPLMRRFVLIGPDGEPHALMFFDPICRDGTVVGYLTSIKRRTESTSNYAEVGLTKHAVDVFKAEGRERVMLGLSPLGGLAASGFSESRLFHALLRRTYGSQFVNRRVFNVQGHEAMKRRFHGREEPCYFAWAGGSPFLPFMAMLRLCRAF